MTTPAREDRVVLAARAAGKAAGRALPALTDGGVRARVTAVLARQRGLVDAARLRALLGLNDGRQS
jgi:UDP:flavonoid glycosyltransferase YjiC (YdhE family)